jgi:YYY domain-containing protein
LPGTYGYNLAMVLVFALTFSLSTCLAAALAALLAERSPTHEGIPARAWGFSLVSGLFISVCGNLVGPLELLAARGLGSPGFWATVGVKNLHAAPAPSGWLPADGGWWWHASRVIPTIKPDGISEFPFFSFLLGDLHPHFTALPLLLLLAAVALTLLLEGEPRCSPGYLLVAGLALGVTIVANTWDLATFWLLYALAAGAAAWRLRGSGPGSGLRQMSWLFAPIPIGVALFSPYFVGYASQSLGLARVADATPLSSFLIIFGPLLLLAMMAVLRLAALFDGRFGPEARLLAFAALVAGLLLMATGQTVAGLVLALLVLAGGVARRVADAWTHQTGDRGSATALYLVGLLVLALAVLLGTEVLYIRDSFGTRMNTVFKFYYHVWLLLGLLTGPALALWSIHAERGRLRAPLRLAVAGTGAGLLVLGLIYPVAATVSKSGGFRGSPTLDGGSFLDRSKPGDAAAIRWLSGRGGRPVVLEAIGGDYEEFARVSTFSGLPTVLGWVGHELQWRGHLDEYSRRQQDVEAVYQSAERDEALRILGRYRVSYVFVGSLEQQKYGPQADERLGRWLVPVFRHENTTIYAVPREDQGA